MVSSKRSELAEDNESEASIEQKATATSAGARGHLVSEIELQDCREELRRLRAALKQLRSENLELNRAMDRKEAPSDLKVLVQSQARHLDLMYASYSWRITAPLRLLARMLGAD